ncbi:MAG TPA: pseudouridine synthase [Syntrophorhabdaceae bacterium]|nr:pseudouridine synthase [Syntrophorhabdaceae bacterium]
MERLVKFVAHVSAFSRRKSEDIIRAGRVRINGSVVTEPFREVVATDRISIDNREIISEPVKIYIALYKPDGYMSDLTDPRGRGIARDLIKLDVKLYPVGRLDYHSEGLMIFTNDGDFANLIMHPRYEVEKEYFVKFKGILTKDEMKRIENGVMVDGGTLKAHRITFVRSATQNAWYSVVVHEGKNRMIRKIGEALGHQVLKLKRIRIGNLLIGDMKPGEYRYFEKNEVLGPPRRQTKAGHDKKRRGWDSNPRMNR